MHIGIRLLPFSRGSMKLLQCIMSMFVIMHLYAASEQLDKERMNNQLLQRCTEPIAYYYDELPRNSSKIHANNIYLMSEVDLYHRIQTTVHITDTQDNKREIKFIEDKSRDLTFPEAHWLDNKEEQVALKLYRHAPHGIYRISFMSLLNQLNEHQLNTLSTLLNQHTDPTQAIPITRDTYQWYRALPADLQHGRIFAHSPLLDLQLFTTSLVSTMYEFYSMWCRTRD